MADRPIVTGLFPDRTGVHPRNDEDAAYFEKSWKENRAQDVYR